MVPAAAFSSESKESASAEALPRGPNLLSLLAPLEAERVRPSPTPDVRVTGRQEAQVIVLRDYIGSTPLSSTPLPPIVLHVPNSFFARPGGSPHEVWGINFQLRYPQMQPFGERTCPGYCDGYVLLTLENRDAAQTTRRLSNFISEMHRDESASSAAVSYERLEAPPGYTDAYARVFNLRRPPQTMVVYAQRDVSGRVTEYVDCRPRAPSPSCRFSMALDAKPHLEIQYSISMEFWEQRLAVREAMQRMVQSFLAD